MGMTVQHNLSAMNANRNLGITTGQLAKSTEKLSSGYKINRAGDDAAGLAISEKMRGQIRGLNQASANSEDGISLIQTAEGALQESQNIIQRMRELAVQAASDTNTDDDRKQIQQEVNQLTNEVDRIANTTEFNTKKLLDGSVAGSTKTVNGTAKVEGTFTNGEVSVAVASEADVSGNADAIKAFGLTDTLRIEFLTDGRDATGTASSTISTEYDVTSDADEKAAAGFKATSLNQISFVADDGTVSAGSYAYDGDAGTITVSDGTNEVAFTVKNSELIKAGDVVTISLSKAVASANAEDGKEALKLQVGANSGQEVEVAINSMKAKDLGITQTKATSEIGGVSAGTPADQGLNTGAGLDVSSQAKASVAIDAYDKAIQTVSTARAKMGAMQNRLEHTISNLDTSGENLQAAESRIRDVDMAKEMTQYSKSNILQQAGQSMLAQANQSTQGVLSLLR